MKAAILKSFGSPLHIETISDPQAGTGDVIVDVTASAVLNYSDEVLSGARKYLLDLPAVPGPGAVGRVRTVGPDATQLKVGDWVYCDSTVRARDDVQAPDIILQGWTAAGERALHLQRYHRDGAWSEQMRTATENVFRLGEINAEDAASWCTLGTFLVPYGGLLAIKLQAGETLLINGATGNFGSAAVAVALGMGAGCVIATGRNAQTLADLKSRFGPRLRTIVMSGDEANDREAIAQMADGRIDCMLDLLPPMATTAQGRPALLSVRPNGRIALMGGVGMLGGAGLDIPYPWIMRNNITIQGQWMYPLQAVPQMIALMRAGLVRREEFTFTSFPLARANEAVTHAAANAGPFRMTLIEP